MIDNEPKWHGAFPRVGGKTRDAERVASWVAAHRGITRYCAPFAGLFKEGLHLPSADLVVADADPALRSIWLCAHEGMLSAAASDAHDWWAELLREHEDKPPDRGLTRAQKAQGDGAISGAWVALRQSEPPASCPTAHAAWTIAIGAGANNAGWRRNAQGVFSWPYSASYDPAFLPRRIFGGKDWLSNAREASAWAKGHVEVWSDGLSLLNDEAQALVWSEDDRLYDAHRTAYFIDPPYGAESGKLYTADWGPAQVEQLATQIKALVENGAPVWIWCDGALGKALRGVRSAKLMERLKWERRGTRTLMKAAVKDPKTGEVIRPARYGGGGLMAYTTSEQNR